MENIALCLYADGKDSIARELEVLKEITSCIKYKVE